MKGETEGSGLHSSLLSKIVMDAGGFGQRAVAQDIVSLLVFVFLDRINSPEAGKQDFSDYFVVKLLQKDQRD